MSDERRRALAFAAASTVAVGALAGVVARMTVLVPMDRASSTVEAKFGETLVLLLIVAAAVTVLAAFTVVPLYGTLSERVPGEASKWFAILAVGAVGCLAVGFVGIQPFATGFADAHVNTYGGYGGPQVDFEVSVEWVGDDRAIVTYTHAGGAPVLAEHLHVRGDGFADVDGVDHQEAGPWRGTVSGERPRRGGPAVVEGDRVTVGVEGDCSVGVAYESDETRGIYTGYECPEHRTEP